jgi:predicted Zn-dependent protease
VNTIIKKTIILHLVVVLCFLGGSETHGFTIGEEREVGERLYYMVRSRFEVLDEPDLKQYLRSLGKEVIDTAGVQFFNYHFYVIEDKEFNAFAAPSGLIFFHSGLIEKMESENELVSVLAHEIGHIAKRHISSRIKKGTQISAATMGLVLASIALGGGVASQALLAGSLAAGQSASLYYSRLDEEEADLLAYDWMKELNRNPEGQVNMLKTMRRVARYRSGMVPQYLLTHPNPEARLDYVQNLVANDKAEIEHLPKGDDFSFLRFKYRTMSLTRDGRYLRKYYASVLTSPRADKLDQIMAKYGMSQLERKENNYSKGLETLAEVIDALGEKPVLIVDKGILEYESGQLEKAYTTLTDVYDSDRSDKYAAFALAKVCFEMGMLDKAENLFKGVMYEIPDLATVYFELGRLSSVKGKSAETSYYLGKYYLYQGQLEQAKKNLKSAVEKDELSDEILKDAKLELEIIERIEK